MRRCRLSPVYRLVTWTQRGSSLQQLETWYTSDTSADSYFILFFPARRSYSRGFVLLVVERLINIAVRHMYYMYRCWVGEWPVRSLRCPPKLLGGINVIRWRRRKRERKGQVTAVWDGIDIKEEERWKEKKKSRKKETAVGYVKREACNNRRTANHSRHKLMATRSSLSPIFIWSSCPSLFIHISTKFLIENENLRLRGSTTRQRDTRQVRQLSCHFTF